MTDQKPVDIGASMRLYYDDDMFGLENVCAIGSHVGNSARVQEFDFDYAKASQYDAILRAARKMAKEGKNFDLHLDVQPDGLFSAQKSYSGHLRFNRGRMFVDFWIPDNLDPVYREGPATTKALLDCIDLVWGGFVSFCHEYTPNDIDLRDPDLSGPYKIYNSKRDLAELVEKMNWGEDRNPSGLVGVIQNAQERAEATCGGQTGHRAEQGL